MEVELQEVSNCAQIRGKAPDGSQEVGELPVELWKLYTLWVNMAKAFDATATEFKWDSANEELKAKLDEYATKRDALMILLRISVKDAFDLWGKTVGVVEGNKVIVFPPQEFPDVPPFFKHFFGME
jgi:hypothetical protein